MNTVRKEAKVARSGFWPVAIALAMPLAFVLLVVGGRLWWEADFERQNAKMLEAGKVAQAQIDEYFQEHGHYPDEIPGGTDPRFQFLYSPSCDSYSLSVSRGVFLTHTYWWRYWSPDGKWFLEGWNTID
jgi:hypothetical protein